MNHSIKEVLRLQVAPALGCTEPAAVALCAAAAASLLDHRDFTSIEAWVSPNIYKNGMAVSIPGTGGQCGIDLAAALGAFGGDPTRKMEVLDPITDDIVGEAQNFIRHENVHLHLMPEKQSIYIQVQVKTHDQVAEAVIQKMHDCITTLKLNGYEINQHNLLAAETAASSDANSELESWLSQLNLEALIALLDDLDAEDLAFINEGVNFNLRLAEYGLTYGPGLGIGKTFERLIREGLLHKDMVLAARMLTSAAADARMSGVKLPAMSSAGSGNHGLTAILPIWAIKDYIVCDDETQVLKAIALSHIITAYVKAQTGRLSAICGCSVAAGAGATGGITYLMGGSASHIASAIKNLISDLAGVICDGAKASCSLKLATAAGAATQSALFALHGIDVKPTDGIVGHSSEETMRNVGQLSTHGMIETDRTILQIMIGKWFPLNHSHPPHHR
ncbi:MAG: serine dehydratase subunit alpha family protein [Methylocystaceae bacterium]